MVLLVIGIFLIKAGLELKETLERGYSATARVTGVEIRNRADVTYGHIDLRVPDEAGDSAQVRLPLPLSLLMGMEEQTEVRVKVLDRTDQPVVIAGIARAQWRMSFIQAAMCLLGALLLAWGVLAWNRHLATSSEARSEVKHPAPRT